MQQREFGTRQKIGRKHLGYLKGALEGNNTFGEGGWPKEKGGGKFVTPLGKRV